MAEGLQTAASQSKTKSMNMKSVSAFFMYQPLLFWDITGGIFCDSGWVWVLTFL